MFLFQSCFVELVVVQGCGKSSLMKVMLGFLPPTSGYVYINGQKLSYSHDALIEWRKQVSVVSQDSLMFKRSIRANITYGNEDVSDEELNDAAQRACLTDWLNTLPNGLDTMLVKREKQLSGGQRQRIQICRALLRSKKIVFMVRASA